MSTRARLMHFSLSVIVAFCFTPVRAQQNVPDPKNPVYSLCLLGPDDYHDVGNCGNWDAIYYCTIPLDTIAQDMCAIHTPHGIVSVPYDPVTKTSDHPGLKFCGVPTYRVACHYGQTPYQISYDTGVRNGQSLPTGGSEDQLASFLCLHINSALSSHHVLASATNNYGRMPTWLQGVSTTIRVLCYSGPQQQ
jgi:hypothetical protein